MYELSEVMNECSNRCSRLIASDLSILLHTALTVGCEQPPDEGPHRAGNVE